MIMEKNPQVQDDKIRKDASDEDFDTRLRRARGIDAKPGRGGMSALPKGGVALALRIGTELVAALGVGIGIGLLLDYWLETKPWFMVAFFFIGAAAGFLNVFRAAQGFGGVGGNIPGSRSSESKDDGGEE